jgi:hypothetical protein
MDAKVIAALVVLVIGMIITIGVVASAVNAGDKAKDDMMVFNYKPPPPPSPAPHAPRPPSPPPPSPPTTVRRLSDEETIGNGVKTTFPITEKEKRSILSTLSKRNVAR